MNDLRGGTRGNGFGGVTNPIRNGELEIVVNNTSLSNQQINALNNVIDYGKRNGVNVNIIVGMEPVASRVTERVAQTITTVGSVGNALRPNEN